MKNLTICCISMIISLAVSGCTSGKPSQKSVWTSSRDLPAGDWQETETGKQLGDMALTDHVHSAEYINEKISGLNNEVEDILQRYATLDNLEEIKTAMARLSPIIETPDGKKWTAQGRYVDGQLTHVWVPYTGIYSAPIRIAMPDGKIFEMAGRYTGEHIVTHTWIEVTE